MTTKKLKFFTYFITLVARTAEDLPFVVHSQFANVLFKMQMICLFGVVQPPQNVKMSARGISACIRAKAKSAAAYDHSSNIRFYRDEGNYNEMKFQRAENLSEILG